MVSFISRFTVKLRTYTASDQSESASISYLAKVYFQCKFQISNFTSIELEWIANRLKIDCAAGNVQNENSNFFFCRI